MRGAKQEKAALFVAAALAASVAGTPASAQAIWTDFTGDGWWHTFERLRAYVATHGSTPTHKPVR